MGLSASTLTIYEDEHTKPPKTTTVMSYILLAIISGFILGEEISQQFGKNGFEFDMGFYEFAVILIFAQALLGVVRFGKSGLIIKIGLSNRRKLF